MRGERRLLRLGEYLVGRACQQLPPDVREERRSLETSEAKHSPPASTPHRAHSGLLASSLSTQRAIRKLSGSSKSGAR